MSEPTTRGPGLPAPWMRWLLEHLVTPVITLAFRPSMHGLEHLPAEGPYLLVGNHSAGMAMAEISSFAALYLRHVGPQRPIAGFAHHMVFRFPVLGDILRGFGAVPSTYEGAYEALDHGVPLLVFPGGDHEAMRPIWQVRRVDFHGRKGFLRIARERQLPVVPMGIRGSHFTSPILLRARWLPWALIVPRALGFKRWAITLLSLLVAVAIAAMLPLDWPWRALLIWLWLMSPMVFLPIVPWTVRFEIGEAIAPPGGDEDLEAYLAQLESTIAALVHKEIG